MSKINIKELKLEKEMYTKAKDQGISFSEYLEKIDEKQGNEYSGKLQELGAYGRQLAANGVKIAGGAVSLVQDFFRTTASSLLFPEFVNRNIILGMNQGKLTAKIEDIIATKTMIDGQDYRGASAEVDDEVKMSRVSEGARIPAIKFSTKEKATRLQKIGLVIDASYESIRRVRANVLGTMIRAIGIKLSQEIVLEGINVIINGDGNSNSAGKVNVATDDTLAYSDLLKFFLKFDPYESDIWIANTDTINKVLSLAEFKQSYVVKDFLNTGSMFTPFGSELKRNTGMASDLIVGLNKQAALEFVEEKGSNLTETDKLIDKQLEQIVISKVCGFRKLMPKASYVLDHNTA